MPDRVPFDLDAYERRIRQGCYICALVGGDPAYDKEKILYDDGTHIAYLSGYPTLIAYALVAPKAHLEHVVRDLTEDAYLAMMAVVRRVAIGIETVLAPERTYLLSLGSQQGNAHIHWHVAPLPPGVPYREQQYHALMGEHGILAMSDVERTDLAERIRSAIPAS